MVHADGSVIKSWDYLRQNGLQGFIDIWPRPTAVAWKLIACFGAFEAALQLLLPGKRVEGPISPTGHRPVYKVYIYCFGGIYGVLRPFSCTKLKKFVLFLILLDFVCNCCRQMVWPHMQLR